MPNLVPRYFKFAVSGLRSKGIEDLYYKNRDIRTFKHKIIYIQELIVKNLQLNERIISIKILHFCFHFYLKNFYNVLKRYYYRSPTRLSFIVFSYLEYVINLIGNRYFGLYFCVKRLILYNEEYSLGNESQKKYSVHLILILVTFFKLYYNWAAASCEFGNFQPFANPFRCGSSIILRFNEYSGFRQYVFYYNIKRPGNQ